MGKYSNYFTRTKELVTRYIPIKTLREEGFYDDMSIACYAVDYASAVQALIEDNISVKVDVTINDGTTEYYDLKEYIDNFIEMMHDEM